MNGYGVINLIADEEEVTCTGIFTHVDEGECIEVTGDYVEHAVYGTQFKVEKYRVVPPEVQWQLRGILAQALFVG